MTTRAAVPDRSAVPDGAARAGGGPAPPRPRDPALWIMAASAAALGLIFVATWLLAHDSPPAPASPVAAGDADIATLEAAVAEDPDDHVARLRLAAAHFDASAYDEALTHYLAILDAQPRHARALARSGWIAFEGGDSALAARLLAQSLEAQPDDPEALWFLAHVRLFGHDDPAGAEVPLRRLLARDDLSDGFRRQVDRLLTEARDALADHR